MFLINNMQLNINEKEYILNKIGDIDNPTKENDKDSKKCIK